MTEKQTLRLPEMYRDARMVPASLDEKSRTVNLVWTTGARVRRAGWDVYDEDLLVDENAIRWDRLRSGSAPVLNSHSDASLDDQIGVVEDAWLEDGQGVARVRLADVPSVDETWEKIRQGIVKNVSVGYLVHKFEEDEEASPPVRLAVDWEPLEISLVTVPADARSQLRSNIGRTSECLVVRRKSGRPDTTQQEHVMSKNDTNAAAAVRAAADDPKIKTPESEMDDDDTQDDGDDENDRADAKAKDDDKRSSPEPKKRGRPRKSDAERAKPKPPSPSDGDESADDDDDEPAANLRLVEAVEKRLMVERRRISDIRDAAQRWDADAAIEKRAIDEGWDMKRFGYEAMEHAIQNQPKIDHRIYPKITGGRDARETAGEAMVNAMLNRAHGDRVPLSDHAREYRGMSILDMAKESLTDHGVRVRGMNRFEIAGEAMKKRAGSAAGMHSTSDFPGILENALNKSLRMGYQESARSFTAWARRTTVSDFRAAPRVMMSETPALLKVNEHSEFKEGAITESREFNQVHTYGRIVSITRQVLVNDDLGAFTTIPQRFGASVAALESDIVYGVLLSNPTLLTDSTALFHADHNNLDGTGAAISLTNVQTGRAAIWNQTGLSGRPINVPPKFILVPPELELLAWQLVTMVTPNQSNQVTPDYIRNMVVIVEPRLKQGANGAAGDANAWYLIADPMTVDTIEYAYLEGSEGVYTETEDGFDVDGMRVKVRHDFGAAAIDYRGMYKNVGA